MAKKTEKKDIWVKKLEMTLRLGSFVRYNECWDFVSDLESLLGEFIALTDQGESKLGVELLELFLSGCYEKMEEIDDSGGNLGMFFSDLFCAWISARQAAGLSEEETVDQILSWMRKDNYGVCYNIEAEVAKSLDRRGRAIFRAHFENALKVAFEATGLNGPCRVLDLPWEVRSPHDALRKIYVVQKSTKAYLELLTRIEPSPKDCKNLASMFAALRNPEEALAWVKRGMKLEKRGRWGNESALGLSQLLEELLKKLGRTDEALTSVWERFRRYPTDRSYAHLMEFVPDAARAEWHTKALAAAGKADLSGFLSICTATRELDEMAGKVEVASHPALENMSHFVAEAAAKCLLESHPAAAAKLFRAMGIRVLKSKKSKYYPAAIENFRCCRDLYLGIGKERTWTALVSAIRKQHSRKRSFIGDFEDLVAGEPRKLQRRLRPEWSKDGGIRRRVRLPKSAAEGSIGTSCPATSRFSGLPEPVSKIDGKSENRQDLGVESTLKATLHFEIHETRSFSRIALHHLIRKRWRCQVHRGRKSRARAWEISSRYQ